jgi:hypothetical protein
VYVGLRERKRTKFQTGCEVLVVGGAEPETPNWVWVQTIVCARDTERERERGTEGDRWTVGFVVLAGLWIKVWSFNLLILLLSAVGSKENNFPGTVFVLINRSFFFSYDDGVWDFISADH